MENCKDNSGPALLAGLGIAGGIALIHNAAKNDRHQQELQQVYSQGYAAGYEEMKQALSAKGMEISYLHALLKLKDTKLTKQDADIARLNSVVENQASTLKWQQLQLTAPMLSQGGDGNNGGGLN